MTLHSVRHDHHHDDSRQKQGAVMIPKLLQRYGLEIAGLLELDCRMTEIGVRTISGRRLLRFAVQGFDRRPFREEPEAFHCTRCNRPKGRQTSNVFDAV